MIHPMGGVGGEGGWSPSSHGLGGRRKLTWSISWTQWEEKVGGLHLPMGMVGGESGPDPAPSPSCQEEDLYWYTAPQCSGRISKVAMGLGLVATVFLLVCTILAVLLIRDRRRRRRRYSSLEAQGPRWGAPSSRGGCLPHRLLTHPTSPFPTSPFPTSSSSSTTPAPVSPPAPKHPLVPPSNPQPKDDSNWYEDDGDTWSTSDGFHYRNMAAESPPHDPRPQFGASTLTSTWGEPPRPPTVPQHHPSGGERHRNFTPSLELVDVSALVGPSPPLAATTTSPPCTQHPPSPPSTPPQMKTSWPRVTTQH